MTTVPKVKCDECGRIFYMDVEEDVNELHYGHDCEEE